MELSSSNIKKFIIFSDIYRNENPRKISYISGNGTFLHFRKRNPNKLTIFQEVTFRTFLYYLLAAQASSFLIHFLWLTGHHAIPEVTTLISFFWDLWFAMPHQKSLISPLTTFVTTFVTYGTPCHARGHHSHFSPNLYLGRERVSLGVANILRICLYPHS